MFTLNCKGKLLLIEKPLVMGIINATPDSFYEGHIGEGADGPDGGAGGVELGGRGDEQPHARAPPAQVVGPARGSVRAREASRMAPSRLMFAAEEMTA